MPAETAVVTSSALVVTLNATSASRDIAPGCHSRGLWFAWGGDSSPSPVFGTSAPAAGDDSYKLDVLPVNKRSPLTVLKGSLLRGAG
mmetsp:Transcript_29015/g.75253  ORF Transcript_29015/g.75253 Transcript_29015/m.75253 type:complete len:87 (-) Transcript_29015:113-373(-)